MKSKQTSFYLKKIKRLRSDLLTRENYLRLEKNERVSKFDNKFIGYLKKNISSYHLTSYPELESVYLNLSKNLKINKNNLVITGGADLAIKNCFELFVRPKDKIITLTPAFAMIDIYSKLFQVKSIKFGYDKNLSLNIGAIKKKITKNIKMIIISNPNNPTGTIISKKNMISLISQAKKYNIPFVVDEVYFGFSNVTLMKEIKKYKNLVIIRTFSKSSGLAALRAGYIIADKKIAELLYKFKPMYEINSITALAVNFILKNQKIEKNYLKEVEKGKSFLFKSLKKLKIKFLDTPANFIHFKINKTKNVSKIVNYLKEKRILVRAGGPGVKGFESFIRVTLGSPKDMKKLVFHLIKKRKII